MKTLETQGLQLHKGKIGKYLMIAEVDFDAKPLPLIGSHERYNQIERHITGRGKVTLEKIDDSLYLNGERIKVSDDLVLSGGPKPVNSSFCCRVLQIQSTGEVVGNANLLDFLLEHPGFIPHREWCSSLKGEYGYSSIEFFGTVYTTGRGDCLIRTLCPPQKGLFNPDEWDATTIEFGGPLWWEGDIPPNRY